jgi:RimJ/RimL family protein N-acetyltransferase
MHYPFIVGEKIFLTPVEREEFVTSMLRWVNDPEATYYMFTGLLPVTSEMLAEEYERITRSQNDVMFGIVDKETDTYVGNVGLYQINWIARHAEMRRFIGEKGFHSRGFGTEAAKLIVAFGFERLNLNKIWAGVNIENVGSWKSDEKAGFVREGILRQEIYRHGRYYDAMRLSILREEYFARKERERQCLSEPA